MDDNHCWVTRGFEAFRRGTFGNAGQNLYVSRAGILQRIHLFDLNQDGYLDLVLCNAQEHHESPPISVYTEVLDEPQRMTLPSDGSGSGVVCDLNGDGLDDLVAGMEANGATNELHSFIYYGSEEGLTPKYHLRLPAPNCTDVAAGDFNGDGRPDLALLCRGKLRLFYQGEIGFEAKRFVELPIAATHLAATDLDGDGYCDLYCTRANGEPGFILWGGPDGFDADRISELPPLTDSANHDQEHSDNATSMASAEENIETLTALAKIIRLKGRLHLFVATRHRAYLLPVLGRDSYGAALSFQVARALSVAGGDVRGHGAADIVFAALDSDGERECSWLYLEGGQGYSESNRIALTSQNACDVALGDLDGNGCDDIVLCQHWDEETWSFHSLVFRGNPHGIDPNPIRLSTEGARRVLIMRPTPDRRPHVVFINRYARNAVGRMEPAIFWGGADGFDANRAQYLSGLGCVASLGCDVNDDGRPDLLLVNCAENAMHLDPGSYLFIGKESGFVPEPDFRLPTHTAMAAACGDINRDGYLDFIFSGFSHNEVLIFHGGPNGFTAEPQRIFVEDEGERFIEGRRLLLADFNNDGWLDLLLTDVVRDRCFLLWGGPEGFSFTRKQTLSVFRASAPQAADLTGNGYLDLIIGAHKPSLNGPHDSFLYVYWNGPQGLREDRRTQVPVTTALNISIADFNNDGLLDIFVPSYHDGRIRDIDSYIYWGGPDGSFSTERCTTVRTHSAAGCLAADFNEDGYIDLAIANHKTFGDHIGESYVLWNGPDGFDLRRMTRLPSRGPHGISHIGPGNQADRGDEEFYVSEPYNMPALPRVCRVTWDADLPPKTWVRAQVRTARAREALDAAPWRGPNGADSWFADETETTSRDDDHEWIQYRLALGATNSGNTPRVRDVRVEFN